MTARTNAIAAAVGLTLGSGVLAQDTTFGPVGNWEGESAEVALMGREGPEPVGSIDGEGLVTIALPASAEQGRLLADMFTCNSEGEVSISPADAAFTPGGLAVVDMVGEEFFGELVAFSSADYGEAWLDAMGNGSSPEMPGATYRLVHVSGPVTVTGRCAGDFWVDGGAGSAVKQVSEYEINFTAGWNLLKTDTRDTVTSALGVTFPLEVRMEGAAVNDGEVYWHLDDY